MVWKRHFDFSDHYFFAKVRGQCSNMRGARKLLIGRSVVYASTTKRPNNSFLPPRMLEIWLSTFAKKMLFWMNYVLWSTWSIREFDEKYWTSFPHTGVKLEIPDIRQQAYMCDLHCAHWDGLYVFCWGYRGQWSWLFWKKYDFLAKISDFSILYEKKFSMKIFNFLKSSGKQFSNPLSKFLCR